MNKQATKFLLATLAVGVLIPAGCAAAPALNKHAVKGRHGARLEVSWVREHRRPLANGMDDEWAKVGLAVDSHQNVYLLDKPAKHRTGRGWSLRKYDRDGDLAWTVRQPPKRGQKLLGQSVVVDKSGDILVLAVARRQHRGVYLRKYSPAGKLIWETRRPFQPKPRTGPFRLALDESGAIYAAGTGVLEGRRRPWLGRFAADGRFLWEKWPFREGLNWGDVLYLESGADDGAYSPDAIGMATLYTKQGSWSLESWKDYQPESTLRYRPDGTLMPNYERFPEWAVFRYRSDIFGEDKSLFAQTPRGFVFRVPRVHDGSRDYRQLNVWIELVRASEPDARMMIAQAPERPGIQYVDPKQLVADVSGNAYVAVVERRPKYDLTRLFKVRLRVPPVEGKIRKKAARLAEKGFQGLGPMIADWRRRAANDQLGGESAGDPRVRDDLSAIEIQVRSIDERNGQFAIGLRQLARGHDLRALEFFADPIRHGWSPNGGELFPGQHAKRLKHLVGALRALGRQQKAAGEAVQGIAEADEAQIMKGLAAVSCLQTLLARAQSLR